MAVANVVGSTNIVASAVAHTVGRHSLAAAASA